MPLAVNLRANNGMYVGAEGGGGRWVDARRAIPREHETFFAWVSPDYTRIKGGDLITLQTYDNEHHIMAVNGGGGEVNAVSTQGSTWESYNILRQDGSDAEITSGDKVALRTIDGSHYIMAVNGGGDVVNAVSTQFREWETFTIQNHGPAPWRKHYGPTKVGDGQFQECNVTFSENGWVNSENETWTTNKTYGFTGGFLVFFEDRATNVIGNLPLHKYGVDGTWIVGLPSSRNVTQNDYVGPEIFANTWTIRPIHKKSPTQRLEEAVNTGKFIGKAAAEVAAVVAAI